MTFAIPLELTTLASDIAGHLDSMLSHSGNACDLFGTMGATFDDAASAIAKAAEHAVHAVTKAVGDIAKSINTAITKLTKLIQDVADKIATLASNAIIALNNAISNAIGNLTTALSGALSNIGTAIKGVVDSIGAGLDDLKKKLASAIGSINLSGLSCKGVQGLATTLGAGVSAGVSAVGVFAKGIAPPSSAALTGSAGTVTAAASTSSFSDLGTSLSNTLSGVVSDIEAALA